ncbi:MAG: aspartate carbamoyltransferase regulatory subunit [Candidatus Woesearchaeota archaeon]
MKELSVAAISEGTVIDHIPSQQTFKVVEILNLSTTADLVSVATNLESKRMHKKGIVKIGGRELSKREVDKIALVAPRATLNIIKNYKVYRKIMLTIPGEVEKIVKCFNPNCITNHEKVTTKFVVTSKQPLSLKCHYCERIMAGSEMVLL